MDSPRQTSDALLESLSQLSSTPNQRLNSWIFRGLGDADWKLVPTAFRIDENRLVGEQMKCEFDEFNAFVDAMDKEGLPVPGDCPQLRDQLYIHEYRPSNVGSEPVLKWPPNVFLPALALGQHHGLRTRLLDWTYDYRVAAYFAASTALKRARNGPAPGHFAVYALFDAIQTPVEAREHRALSNQTVWRVYIPPFGNSRLRAQDGLFTLYDSAPNSIEENCEKLCLDELRKADMAKNLSMTKYTVPFDQAEPLLTTLRLLGISAGKIWTGYTGAVLDVEEQRQRQKPK